MTEKSLIEIAEADIRNKGPLAETLLKGFPYAPEFGTAAAPATITERSPGVASRIGYRPTSVASFSSRSSARQETVNLLDRLMKVGGSALPSPTPASVLQAVNRALSVSLVVSDLFADRTGLNVMLRDNAESRLAHESRAEFGKLSEAQSLVALSVFANVLAARLSASEGSETVDVGAVRELVLQGGVTQSLRGAIWELDQKVEQHAADDAHLIATTLSYARALSEIVKNRASGHPAVKSHETADYRIESDDLTLSGFEQPGRKRGASLSMTFKKPEEVIGNAIAKHQSLRLSKMMMAYDMDRRMNPFAELGGFIFTFMGDGKPGTGKTTLIQMMAGMLNDYCQVAGYPFTYRNLSVENVDSYQGKSGQNAKAFIDAVLDPSAIGFGTIDDIDQVAGKRGDRQSSSGQQEITAVLMEAFAGANTVVRGNCTFGMFSNYPENVDDALRQRAGARFLVDGPQSREDYIDILAVLLGKNHSIPVGTHDLFVHQEIRRAVKSGYEHHNVPQEAGLAKVYAEVRDQVGALDTLEKFGTYLKAIQQADERFTGRAIKNITDAVKVRAMDFELPDAWFESASAFMHKPYDEKMGMISELRTPITPEMLIQEVNRYADSEFRYADKSDEAAISGMVRDLDRSEKARARYKDMNRGA